jgi:hypothetical protein
VRIAIHHVGDVGLRAGRILLGERRLTALGIIGSRPNTRPDPRLEAASDITTYDLLVSDDTEDPVAQAEKALAADVSCVLWADPTDDLAALGDEFAAEGLTLLVGANLASGIAPCLASHESARTADLLEVRYAWTEPGRPLRRGEPIPFPDPIGACWGRDRGELGISSRFVAPVDGEWAGAMARVTIGTPAGVVSRVVGVADHAAHLEAIALAAGAVTVDDHVSGLTVPVDRSEAYLAAALEAGLDVASYSTEPAG